MAGDFGTQAGMGAAWFRAELMVRLLSRLFSRVRGVAIQASGSSDIGRARDHNEDALLVALGGRLVAVADGMGGHDAGEVASTLALDTLRAYFEQGESRREPRASELPFASVSERRLVGAVRLANARVHEMAQRYKRLRGMGSTIVAGLFDERAVYIAHAGDSRAYRLRRNVLVRLTRDHSLREAMAEMRQCAASEVEDLAPNVIVRALGAGPDIDVETSRYKLERGDRYLFCSDGLSGYVGDRAIQAILTTHRVRAEAVTELIAAANTAGGEDNITAVLADVS